MVLFKKKKREKGVEFSTLSFYLCIFHRCSSNKSVSVHFKKKRKNIYMCMIDPPSLFKVRSKGKSDIVAAEGVLPTRVCREKAKRMHP